MTPHHTSELTVAFICVHNSCRSQMAEGYLKRLAGDTFAVYSAGTEDYNRVKPKAIEVMQEVGIDISSHYPKRLKAIPEEVDILITMGCNVNGVDLLCRHKEDWGIVDPSGGSLDDFRQARDTIKQKCVELIERVQTNQLVLESVTHAEATTITDSPTIINNSTNATDESAQPVEMTANQYDDLIRSVNQKANYPLGILLGLVFGLIGAGIWALITKLTGYNIGLIAIVIGFLVSQGFVMAGRSTKIVMGITAAIIAFISIFFGNIAIGFLQIADYYDTTFIDVAMNFDYENYLIELITEIHTPFDIIFYGIAMLTAFKRSFVDKNSLNVNIVPNRHAQQNDIFE